MRGKIVVVLMAMLFVTGCEKVDKLVKAAEKAEEQSVVIAGLDARLKSAEAEAKQQQEYIDFLLRKLGEAEEQIKNQSAYVETEMMKRVAHLRPQETGYDLFLTDMGTMAVSLSDVKPYANGSKVTLNFGNLLSMSLHTAGFNIEWRSSDPEDSMLPKRKDVKIVQPLFPGNWQAVPVILEGVPPAKLASITVYNFQSGSIAARRPY